MNNRSRRGTIKDNHNAPYNSQPKDRLTVTDKSDWVSRVEIQQPFFVSTWAGKQTLSLSATMYPSGVARARGVT